MKRKIILKGFFSSMRKAIIEFSIKKPWIVIGLAVLITAFFAMQFPKIKIDTDPQNMLESDEPTRLFHAATKDNFNLYDFIAVGIIAEPTAFTPDQLNRVFRITEEIAELEGVIVDDIMSISMVDDIKQGLGGSVTIGPLMEDEIETDEEAQLIFQRIMANPLLRGKIASDDGKAVAIFIPIESKTISHRLYTEIKEITDRLGGNAEYHVAGLPLAEDSFGAEMFVQMAVSAPAAMAVIFLLLFLFFRQVKIIMAPMIVAMMSVIWAMGLLIYTGNTVHIMSSMIPIFLMPISVLNSIHIISAFHDNFKKFNSKAETLRHSINQLFVPMLFTSMTTVAGFLSLALTPIPPVRVFGIFVAFGIVVAWFLSLTINPAIVMLISEKTLKNFGKSSDEEEKSILAKLMHSFRNIAQKKYKLIITAFAIVILIAGYGLSLIIVNDNPVNWFKKSHPIRIADNAMNAHLAGTYMNYLVFEGEEEGSMKSPELLNYMLQIQDELAKDATVGATTGVTDIVKKIRYELFAADSAKMVIPENQNEIAQLLFVFEMSGGDPDDLFKFVTPEYDKANLWVQLKDGDNIAVSSVVDRGNKFIDENPPPDGINVSWAGLPYINIEWQNQMVSGMQKSLASSFVVVFFMMVFLFRSFKWGFFSMLPLTITVMAIYAFIGYIGKPYDMPVAVLSSLTLGLSIDFAIHFIQRLRVIHKRTENFDESFHEIFEGTGRAISRNVMVIAIGFLPMLFSTLVPNITVGAFFFAIMIVSGLVTMLLLPSITQMFKKSLFR